VGHTPGMPLSIAKTCTKGVPTYLVECEHSVIDIPVLDIDLSMRGIRHTINRDLELLGAFLSAFRTNLFLTISHLHRNDTYSTQSTNLLHDRLDVYHRSEDIRTSSDRDDSCVLRDQRQESSDVVGHSVWVVRTICWSGVPIAKLQPVPHRELLPWSSIRYECRSIPRWNAGQNQHSYLHVHLSR